MLVFTVNDMMNSSLIGVQRLPALATAGLA